MKLFEDLSAEQQRRAVEHTFEQLVVAVTECGLRFDDAHNGNRLQVKIDQAQFDPDRYEITMETWQVRVRRDCREELMALAEESAKTAVFTEGETAIAVGEL